MPATPSSPTRAGSSPLSSPLSHVSTLSSLSSQLSLTDDDNDNPRPADDPATDGKRARRATTAAAPALTKASGTTKAVDKGKRKRPSTASSSTPAARKKTRTSRAVKEEQLVAAGVDQQQQQLEEQEPTTTTTAAPAASTASLRRSGRGSLSATTRLSSAPPPPPPPPEVLLTSPEESEAAGPGPSSSTPRKTPRRQAIVVADVPPPPPVPVEKVASPPTLPPREPTSEPVAAPKKAAPAKTSKKASRRSSLASSAAAAAPTTEVSATTTTTASAEQVAPPPSATDAAEPPPASTSTTSQQKDPLPAVAELAVEPGVEWIEGRETCPMCRDAPTLPTAVLAIATAPPPPSDSPHTGSEDVHMTDAEAPTAATTNQATNILGLAVGPTPAAAPTVDEALLDSWISCIKCKRWHHFECIKQHHGETLPAGLLDLNLPDKAAAEKIDKWYCTQAKCSTGKPTLKKEAKRASARPKPQPTYAPSDDDSNAPSPILPSFDLPPGPALPIPTAGNEKNFHRRVSQWPALYASYEKQGLIVDGGYRMATPESLVDEWANEGNQGWRKGGCIVLVENIRGDVQAKDAVEGGRGEAFERLGGRLPDRELTIADVARIQGPDQEIEVLSVDTQNRSSAVPGTAGERWTLAHWARYYAHPQPKVLFNIISYEITGTTLGKQLEPPKAVKDISWVDRHWPSALAPRLPPVQRYLLMSPAGTFTDWHVDMAASSVYYHVVRGEKVFYFIRPTAKHLEAYKKWASTEKQTMEWLGHSADQVYKVVVKPGSTAFIPAGWIHAVYTPKDSLVYGGNFVHTLAIPMQLKVCEIEVAHGEDDEHRFPYFMTLCWFVAKDYTAHLASLQKISSKAVTPAQTTSGRPFEQLTPAVLEALLALARFLCDWVEKQTLKKLKGALTARESKQLKGLIPLKDPFALVSIQLANEFRSRVLTHLKFLGQEAVEAAQEAESLEAGIVNGARQAVVASSKTVTKSDALSPSGSKKNGMVAAAESSIQSDDGFSERWTEPQIETTRVIRPRPGADAGAKAEEAILTRETQNQFQYRSTDRPDGSTTVEIVATTRVKNHTLWPTPAVAQARAAASAAAAAKLIAPPEPAPSQSSSTATSAAPAPAINGGAPPPATRVAAPPQLRTLAPAPPPSQQGSGSTSFPLRPSAPTGPPPPVVTNGALSRPVTSSSAGPHSYSNSGLSNGAQPGRSHPVFNGHAHAPPPLDRRPSHGTGSSTTMVRIPSSSSSAGGYALRPVSSGPGVDPSVQGWPAGPPASSSSQPPQNNSHSSHSSYSLQSQHQYQPHKPQQQPAYAPSSQYGSQASYASQPSSSVQLSYVQYPPTHQVPYSHTPTNAVPSSSRDSSAYAIHPRQQPQQHWPSQPAANGHVAGSSYHGPRPSFDATGYPPRRSSNSPPKPYRPGQPHYGGPSAPTSQSPYHQSAPLPNRQSPKLQRPLTASSNVGAGPGHHEPQGPPRPPSANSGGGGSWGA